MKVTPNKIKQYIEGNLNKLYDDLFGKPDYYKEQILYRISKCKDCHTQSPPRCIVCNCSLPEKHYVERTCNSERFPDLMNEQDWNEYKKENNITIDLKDAKDTDNS